VGMEMAGVVDILWAIESNPQAAKQFQLNHPNVTVFISDANVLLDRAIRREKGEILEPLLGTDSKIIPDLPRPGKVDFIMGGKQTSSWT
jgi:DNA (cytosine-5)-methyltransferase 1